MSSAGVPPAPPTGLTPPSGNSNNPLLDVHLAEYSALTNRVTYFITLQYLTYSIAAVVLTLVAQVWGSNNLSRQLVSWGGFLLFLLLVWAWTYTVWEIFNTAVYLEGDLRQRIARLVRDDAFWGWESYLAAQRAKGYDRYEWTYGLFVLLIVAIFVFGRGISTVTTVFAGWRSNAGWLAVSPYVIAMIAGRIWKTFRLQGRLKELGKVNQRSA